MEKVCTPDTTAGMLCGGGFRLFKTIAVLYLRVMRFSRRSC